MTTRRDHLVGERGAADSVDPPRTSAPAEEDPGPGPSTRRLLGLGARVPWVLVAGITVAGTAISVAPGRIRDIDLYWHLIVGDQIRAGTPVTEAGRG